MSNINMDAPPTIDPSLLREQNFTNYERDYPDIQSIHDQIHSTAHAAYNHHRDNLNEIISKAYKGESAANEIRARHQEIKNEMAQVI